MVAAYAVALQMLLSAAVASQMAAAPDTTFPICFGVSLTANGADGSDRVPLHQASCILCTIGISAPVDLDAPAIAPVVAWADIIQPRPAGDAIAAQAPPGPRLSQGPPAIA